MRVTIQPGVARGSIAAPPSKSMAHRMLVCAGLALGAPSSIDGVAASQDVLATMDCLRALGARVAFDEDKRHATVWGASPAALADAAVLPCRESGSTLRFFVPLALLSRVPVTFTGAPSLLRRPMTVYAGICEAQGLRFELSAETLTVQGPLLPGTFRIPADISSQFISGLLFALPLLAEDNAILLDGTVESRPYIQMTIAVLEQFGVRAFWINDTTLYIPCQQRYVAQSVAVEGDYSNAAFFDALNYLGGNVQVTGLREDSLQGDKVYLDYFQQLSCGSPTLDISDCPDLGPVLMALGAALHGVTLTGARRLAVKESDRGHAMAEELAKCGIQVEFSDNDDTIRVQNGALHAPYQDLSGHNDHRIVMALAVVLSVVGGSIEGAQAVAKSYPDFFARLQELGIKVDVDEVD